MPLETILGQKMSGHRSFSLTNSDGSISVGCMNGSCVICKTNIDYHRRCRLALLVRNDHMGHLEEHESFHISVNVMECL